MTDIPKLCLIVARSQNGVIGRDGDMPWRLSSDLKRFKALTSGKPVIMGRKTWDSLPRKPLPKRPNIVVSRNPELSVPDAWLAPGLTPAIAMARSMAVKAEQDEVFVIGGAGLYEHALEFADRLYLTEVCADLEGDTYFPEIHEQDWNERSSETVPAGEKDDYETVFRVLDRLN